MPPAGGVLLLRVGVLLLLSTPGFSPLKIPALSFVAANHLHDHIWVAVNCVVLRDTQPRDVPPFRWFLLHIIARELHHFVNPHHHHGSPVLTLPPTLPQTIPPGSLTVGHHIT